MNDGSSEGRIAFEVDGTTLARANDRSQLFWLAWADFYPDTTIYRG